MGHKKMNNADNIFTIDDLSAYLKIPKSTLYKLTQQGEIPGQKIGRHWRFSKEIIDYWLASHTNYKNNITKGQQGKPIERSRGRLAYSRKLTPRKVEKEGEALPKSKEGRTEN